MRSTQRIGTQGERIARKFLTRKGYSIVETNWSTTVGEIDIVAKTGDLLVFVEVKTRKGRSAESAFEGITRAKNERLVKAVYQYLHDCDFDDEVGWRIDAIGVALDPNGPPIVEHIEDALDW